MAYWYSTIAIGRDDMYVVPVFLHEHIAIPEADHRGSYRQSLMAGYQA